mmetsp:Transcript_8699/g.20703  ORF Transcript_8699/g.20703 Transcript_8699/m.20703 type:complete len:328 (-) Transcript_8699:166-1149(-)
MERCLRQMLTKVLLAILITHVCWNRTWVGSWAAGRPKQSVTHSRVAMQAESERPVVAVLGANGRTGALIVEALARDQLAIPRALTRSGSWKPSSEAIDYSMDDVEVGQADVTNPSSLAAALVGVSAVVFAAAYSRGKTQPKDVDNAGLVNCAEVVVKQGIERLIVVSSASVTRPYAPVGILLNTIGSGVLTEKLQGENKVKEMLQESSSTYTIVRPGGLSMDPPAGFQELQFNQGDTYVGNVSRADVAAVCAVAATDPANSAAGKTFEMFKAQGRSPLLPWYRGKTRYMVGGIRDCGAMLARLRPDKEVYDVPGALPLDLSDFELTG